MNRCTLFNCLIPLQELQSKDLSMGDTYWNVAILKGDRAYLL